jgi:hypothetical protein
VGYAEGPFTETIEAAHTCWQRASRCDLSTSQPVFAEFTAYALNDKTGGSMRRSYPAAGSDGRASRYLPK